MKKIIIAALIGTAALTACASEPTARARPAAGNIGLSSTQEASVMDIVWAGSTATERRDMCLGYNTLGPQDAFDAFDAGAEGAFSYSTFVNFFSTHC